MSKMIRAKVAHEGLVNALARRVGSFGDDVRRHDDDSPPVYRGAARREQSSALVRTDD